MMFKKRVLFLISLVILIGLVTGCTTQNNNQSSTPLASGVPPTDGKPQIITTLFPQYDFTRQIVGDKADVIMLLPAGVESHSYDPTPADIIKINNAKLFIYTGDYMESWAKKIIDGLDNQTVPVLDVSKNVSLSAPIDGEVHGDEENSTAHNHTYDPHIWTDPNNAIIMVDTILDELCRIDTANSDFYKANADSYKAELVALDNSFREVVESGARNKLIFGGKNAFHYFLKQYGLSYEGAYDSCAAEAEPSVRVIADLINEIKKDNIPVIYYEELTTPKVAQSISDETGAKMLLLHSTHNVSKDDFNNGATYLSIMKQNLENLKEGLK